MSKEYQVIHKKSNVLTNGQPKLPSASTIEYGEIAINYAKGGETMSIKNANNEIVTFSSDAKILGQIPAVADYFDGAEYDSNSKRINFKHGNTVKAYIDATNFIKDGMVDDVAVTTPTSGDNSGVTCLVVTFNTDAGKEDIEIPLSLIFNPSNYYNKTEADEKFLTVSSYTEDEEVVATALNDLNERIDNVYVPQYTHELINDSGFITSAYTGFASSAHTHSEYATTAHTHTAAEVGAMATSERSNYSTTGHTHSQYATTAHTHTAAEVGAMATSERSNYLVTGTTLDNVADGSTRKLSNYSTTAHTHTAEEVGAMATSERSNYSTTGHTHDYLPLTGGNVSNHVKVRQNSGTTGTYRYVDVGYDSIEFRSGSTGDKRIFIYPYWVDVLDDGYQLHLPNKSGTIALTNDIPTEANLTSSGFTKDAITAISINGDSVSVTDGNADIYGVLKAGSTVVQDGVPMSAFGGPINFGTLNIVNDNTWEWLKRAGSVDSDGSPVSPTSLQADLDSKASTAHTHSQYATTAHTHTAAEVGAMATSERSNYSTTGHTHSQYATTAHTHTAAEVGAMATSERSNYLTTATTIPTESTITGSGFTKNGITGINVNGTAATITNGVAEINVQGGGGSTLPSVTAADNGKVLMVVNGAWAVVMPTTVYTGTDTPLSSIGNDGDIYLQTS